MNDYRRLRSLGLDDNRLHRTHISQQIIEDITPEEGLSSEEVKKRFERDG